MKIRNFVILFLITLTSSAFSRDYKRHLNLCKKYIDCPLKEKKALSAAERAYKLAPNEPDVILCYGIALRSNRKYTEARKFLKKAVKLLPNNHLAHYYYAFTYAKLRGEDALSDAKIRKRAWKKLTEHINIALRLKPDFARGYTAWGVGYHYLKMYRQAKTSFKKAISLDKKDPWSYLFLGNTYLTLGREKKAEKNFKEAMKLAIENPKCGIKDPHVPRTIAIFYEVDENFDKAEEYAKIALDWNKKDIWPDERHSIKKLLDRIKEGKELGYPLIKSELDEL